VKPYAAYAIGAALVDTEIQVTDAELATMNVEKGMMTLVDQARQRDILNDAFRSPDSSEPRLRGQRRQ
jgi:fructokinase